MSDTARKLSIVPPEPPPSVGPEDDVQLTLMDHLRDLRKRILYSVIVLFVGCCITYYFADPILGWLMQPVLDVLGPDKHIIVTHPTEGFFVNMRAAVYAAVFVTSPFVLYQFYQFVAPGLYRRERR